MTNVLEQLREQQTVLALPRTQSMALKREIIQQLEGASRPSGQAVFNADSVSEILDFTQAWKSHRLLLVHSRALDSNHSYIRNLKKRLGTRLEASICGIGQHSPYKDVIKIARTITENQIDCIICIGSGSYSDACKTARLVQATLPADFQESDMEALVDAKTGKATALCRSDNVRLIVVPTSLSAGEWNHTASCTNIAGKKQHFVLEEGGAPDLILMDPWLAALTPQHLWLSSGMRAIDHCVEMLCHKGIRPYPDAQEWCLTALAELVRGLLSYKRGLGPQASSDSLTSPAIEGISECQYGSRMAIMGLIVYRIPIGASHAIGHQLGSTLGLLHGATTCLLLPTVLKKTLDQSVDAQNDIKKIFRDVTEWDEPNAGDYVRRLIRELGLRDLISKDEEVTEELAENIIDKTMTDIIASWEGFPERKVISSIVYDVLQPTISR